MATLRFVSHVDSRRRRDLEALVFFNAAQQRVLNGIIDAIEKFGPPEIRGEGDRVTVGVAGLEGAQSLIAIDADSGRPLGIAVYVRSDVENVIVLHLGIAEEFAAGGTRANEHLLLRLLGELRRCSRRLKGVRRLVLVYMNRNAEDRARGTLRRLAV